MGNQNPENDEQDILTDQDETIKQNLLTDDENMGAKSQTLDALENDPDDFHEGRVDLKEQMERSVYDVLLEDNHEQELEATFEHTPGGLEEVAMKTDRDLAVKHAHENSRHH